MEFLKLDYIRQHSRLCSNEEDALLTLYANGAEEAVCQLLNRGDTVAEAAASLREQYGDIPNDILLAALMIVDNSYEHRSPIGMQSFYVVPYNIDLFVKPYMKL